MKGSKLVIGRMTVQFPPGFRYRADAIVRELAARLTDQPGVMPGRRERLTVPAVTVKPGEPDSVVADRLAEAIRSEWQAGAAGRDSLGQTNSPAHRERRGGNAGGAHPAWTGG